MTTAISGAHFELKVVGVVRSCRETRLIAAIATFAMFTSSLALAQPVPQPHLRQHVQEVTG